MRTTGPITYPYCYVAYLLARQGRLADAARTIAWIDNRAQRIDRDWLPPIAVSSYKAARVLVDAALTQDERDRYTSERARLSFDQIYTMASTGAIARNSNGLASTDYRSRTRNLQ